MDGAVFPLVRENPEAMDHMKQCSRLLHAFGASRTVTPESILDYFWVVYVLVADYVITIIVNSQFC